MWLYNYELSSFCYYTYCCLFVVYHNPGPGILVNKYSCVCLHGDRRPQERKDNLASFKVYMWSNVAK